MPPLRGLVLSGYTFLHRCRPYRTEEGFWRGQGLWLKPGAVGMQVAFGRVRRKTAPTGPGAARVVFSKIDSYGAVRNANRKCKAKTNLVSACRRPNLGEYTAEPHLPGLGVRNWRKKPKTESSWKNDMETLYVGIIGERNQQTTDVLRFSLFFHFIFVHNFLQAGSDAEASDGDAD